MRLNPNRSKAESLRKAIATMALAALTVPAAASAQRADSAAFIIRLGKDTTSIERYIRTPSQLIIEAVSRSPSTTVHRMVIDYGANNAVQRTAYTVSVPGREQPAARATIEFRGDSAVMTTEQGGQSRTQRVLARNAVPMAGPFYSPYELAVMRAVAASGMKSSVQLLAGGNLVDIPVEKIGRDSVTLTNQFGEPMRAHIDARGRLLHLHTPAYTTLERLPWVDLDKFVADFANRDATGRGMGNLSPRQTYRRAVGGANVWVDYSRPGMRGRPIWGALVPYGRVWRTGANDAAHFSTDRTIEIGGLTLAPGTYTMFLVPAADQWSLIFNKQTGMSGLERTEAQDVGRVQLTKSETAAPVEFFTISVDESGGTGTLSFAWDRTRASVPFTVK
jgi:hypothetical protein